MLNVTSLKKTIGTFSLSIDSLRMTQPGIYGLVGHNGCGKSMLAKLLSGILLPDSGEITTSLDSKDITMVTQKPYIMDDTVYNNLVYPLRLRGVKNAEALCDEYLEKVDLLERKNQRARGLSGGEKQKLSLLRAMIFKPSLIILDEAMTELDLDSLDLFEGMILQEQQLEPRVWIIISHQLAQIKRLCNYIFFMSKGRIEAEGATEDLLHSSNPLVARFLKHEVVEAYT